MVNTYGDALAANALDGLPDLQPHIGGPVLKFACPQCGLHRLPETLIDVRALPATVTNGASFACDACLQRWEYEQRPMTDGRPYSEARLLEKSGGDAASVARLDAIAAARAASYEKSEGAKAQGRTGVRPQGLGKKGGE